MQRKLAGYVLLSFLSFGTFTTLFHTVANAQTLEFAIAAPTTVPRPSPTLALPTPTHAVGQQTPVKYTLQSVDVPIPTLTPKTAEPTTAPAITKTLPAEPTTTPETTPAPTEMPTPTATPLPQPAVAAPADLDPLFDKYASEYGIDKEDLKRIAKCEAGFNPNADTGRYAGMYQFMAETWISTRNAMGLDPNPELRKNAEESIKTAAFKIRNGGRGAWPNC